MKLKNILLSSIVLLFYSCQNDLSKNNELLKYLIEETSTFNLNNENRFDSKDGLFSIIFSNELKSKIFNETNDSIIKIHTYELDNFYKLLLNNVSAFDTNGNFIKPISTFSILISHNNNVLDIDLNGGLIIEALFPENLKKLDLYTGKVFNKSLLWKLSKSIPTNKTFKDTSDIGEWNYINGEVKGTVDSIKLFKRKKHYLNDIIYDKVFPFKPKKLQWFTIGRSINLPKTASELVKINIDESFDDLIVGLWSKYYGTGIILNKENTDSYVSPIPLPELDSIKLFCFGNKGSNYYIAETDIKFEELVDLKIKFKKIGMEEIPFNVKKLNKDDH